MTYPKSRKYNDGTLIALEQMTGEQLRAVCADYSLSQEGNEPELIARIRNYEFAQGKTIQPYDQQTSQTSTKAESKTMTIKTEDTSSKEPQKATKDNQFAGVQGVNPQTGESLPGKFENDAAYAENHGADATANADTVDNRNDRQFRNPKSEGYGTGKEAEKAKKADQADKAK